MVQTEGDSKRRGLKCWNIHSYSSDHCCHIEMKKVTVFNGLPVLGWLTWVVQSSHQYEQGISHANLCLGINLM